MGKTTKTVSNYKKLPYHIGFIVDGNRRWAKEKGLPTFAGHKKGAERVGEVIEYAQEIGIKIVTIYAFSTENWKRSGKEVSHIMKLFEDFANDKLMEAYKQGLQLRVLGDFDKLPESLQKVLKKAFKKTENNQGMLVNIALSYGGRNEIVRAFRKLAVSGVKPGEITEELVSQNLDTAGLPDPDFIVRTSGEQRLSNFLTWQSAYSELYFPKTYWPDFDKKQFDIALKEYRKRQRRLGK
jgi:undecaprenyl diphosphate synthase